MRSHTCPARSTSRSPSSSAGSPSCRGSSRSSPTAGVPTACCRSRPSPRCAREGSRCVVSRTACPSGGPQGFRSRRRPLLDKGVVMATIAFVYGVLGYVVFLVSFLYSIGFVGNLLVPKAIDSGPAGPVAQALLVDLVLLGLFALQHSVMARRGFKRWWTRFVPRSVERSTYVLLSSLLLLLLFWKWQPILDVVWQLETSAGVLLLNVLFWL